MEELFRALERVFRDDNVAAIGLRFAPAVINTLNNVLTAASNVLTASSSLTNTEMAAVRESYCTIVNDVQLYVKRLMHVEVFPQIVGELAARMDASNIVLRGVRTSPEEGILIRVRIGLLKIQHRLTLTMCYRTKTGRLAF